jgi:small GTP-binding protein
VLGEPNVGKSELNKFCSSKFEDSVEQIHEQVYGVSFAVKILKNIDIEMSLVVWNFTGQERYKTLQPHYMTGVSGILLLFDLTRTETFKKLPNWIRFIHQNLSDVPILLIGSKADLFQFKAIEDSDIEQFVNANGLQGYYEVSFKSGLNVQAAISKISELIYRERINGEKISTEFKLERPYPDRPLIVDEEKLISNYLITIHSIYGTIFKEISQKFAILEKSLKEIKKSNDFSKKDWIIKEIERVSSELTTQNQKIQELLDDSPFPLQSDLKTNLSEEWNQKRDRLLYRILIFKDTLKLIPS